jgi:hypothetical protein
MMETTKCRDPTSLEKMTKDSTTSLSVKDEMRHALESGIDETKEQGKIPENVSKGLEQWNKPRINVYRYLATLYCFIIMGMNDAAYGVSLPLLGEMDHMTFTDFPPRH